MRSWAMAALLLAPGQEDTAEKLLKSVQDAIEGAQTLRTEFVTVVERDGIIQGRMTGTFLIERSDRWCLKIDLQSETSFLPGSASLALYPDGRRVSSTVAVERTILESLDGRQLCARIREALRLTQIPLLYDLAPEPRKAQSCLGTARIEELADAGIEQVGDVKARVLSYTARYEARFFGDFPLPVKVWIDPGTRRLLKRETGLLWNAKVVEEYTTFVLDGKLSDAELTFQSAGRFSGARAAQLARSVELFGRFSGRPPSSLEDLLKRPDGLAPEVLYPEGAYVLGGVLPRDAWGRPFDLLQQDQGTEIVSLGADGKLGGQGDDADIFVRVAPPSGQSVGAPTERLKKYYTSRIQIQLLEAALRAFITSYGTLPRRRPDLFEKQDWMRHWPEGGWLAGAALQADPWGEPFRMLMDRNQVRIQVQDPAARRLRPGDLTAEERASLEATGRLRLSAEQEPRFRRLYEDLSNDDLDRRTQAESGLRELGLAVLPALEDLIPKEKDLEVRTRVEALRSSLRKPPSPWKSELLPLAAEVRLAQKQAGNKASNEAAASASLKTLASAEADFRANDRDQNRVNDFWTGDVASLFTLKPPGNLPPIQLIDPALAAADGAPLDDKTTAQLLGSGPAPRSGYWFRMMTTDRSSEKPEPYGMDTGGTPNLGKVYNLGRFGVCAYPEEYGVSGTLTFILNEGNTIFSKDIGGEPLLEWPDDLELRSWKRMD